MATCWEPTQEELDACDPSKGYLNGQMDSVRD
jgi:hypothetical protein